MSDSDAAIRLTNVRVVFGKTAILEGVDAVVPRNRLTAILGPNGAGKTTLPPISLIPPTQTTLTSVPRKSITPIEIM